MLDFWSSFVHELDWFDAISCRKKGGVWWQGCFQHGLETWIQHRTKLIKSESMRLLQKWRWNLRLSAVADFSLRLGFLGTHKIHGTNAIFTYISLHFNGNCRSICHSHGSCGVGQFHLGCCPTQPTDQPLPPKVHRSKEAADTTV